MNRVLAGFVSLGFALALVLTPAAAAEARPVTGGGVVVGNKELCRVQTNWFERYVMQQANTKWVPCKR